MLDSVYIPEFITVHLGAPRENASNVTVSFPDYIKNVASSEIYPTWPENALRANIYAQISFALNRIYTEWYRSQGYPFDITASTQYDQKFIAGRDIFESINTIVDQIFNDYLRRQGNVEPLFAQFCNGTTVTCPGLSQWGTVTLANQGMTPYEIVQYYYGEDIDIVRNAPVQAVIESYPGYVLQFGLVEESVKFLQIRLNRISRNYPAIPKIPTINSRFDLATEQAVIAFQKIFNLTPDGLVGKNTWYKIAFIYNNVKRLSELNSEGLSLSEVSKQFPSVLRMGDTGDGVKVLQYYLSVASRFVSAVPPVAIDGVFGQKTKDAVTAFQRQYGLVQDGIVGRNTWNQLYRLVKGVGAAVPLFDLAEPVDFDGVLLRRGSRGERVGLLQEYLTVIARYDADIPAIPVTSYFGDQTYNAVIRFQQEYGLTPDGIVGKNTWDRITSVYSSLQDGMVTRFGQFPGYTINENGAG